MPSLLTRPGTVSTAISTSALAISFNSILALAVLAVSIDLFSPLMKKLLSLTLASLLVLPIAARAQGTLKIGTVDMNKTFREYNKTKDAEAKINDAKNQAKKEYDERADAYKKALDDINNLNKQLEAPALSADAKAQKAKERDDKISNIKNMEREITEFRQTRERQLQEQALRMREGIVKEISDVVMDKVKNRDHVAVGLGAKVSSNQDQQTRSPNCGVPSLWWIVFVSLTLVRLGQAAPSWESTLTKDPPGNFPELRPVRTTYHFGWSGFTAGTGDIHFTKTADKRFQLEASGRTIGLVRALWRLDASYRGLANPETLRPIESKQTEIYRKKKLVTDLSFTDSGVMRARTEGTGAKATKPFNFPNLFDLHSALLYLRSQPLSDHGVYRIVVYPATSAYLTTVTVLGQIG